jgi:hypothetical protein
MWKRILNIQGMKGAQNILRRQEEQIREDVDTLRGVFVELVILMAAIVSVPNSDPVTMTT